MSLNIQIHSSLISVILPVYNAEKYIKESVESILAQTYTNFEFIIINDGSTDSSSSIIKTFNDSRIRYFEQENQGLAQTLNNGLKYANGKYIARQDSDDISLPERFTKQIEFLDKNNELVLVGTWAKIIDENGVDTGRVHHHSTDNNLLKFELIFDNPFVHSSIMARKDIIEKAGCYSTENTIFEDHNLWSVLSYYHKVANIPEELVKYREVSSGISKTTDTYHLRVINQAEKNLNFYLPEQSGNNRLVAELYNGNVNDLTNNELSLLKDTFSILFDKFFKSTLQTNKECYIRKHVLLVKLNFLRKQINNPKIAYLKNTIYKIKRKLVLQELKKIFNAK